MDAGATTTMTPVPALPDGDAASEPAPPVRLSPASAVLAEDRLPTSGAGRLIEARRLIEEGTVSVVSLDLFDTVLWRRVPRPADVFVLLGDELARRRRLSPDISPEAFRRLRIEAERRARRRRRDRGDGEEVALEEIWAQIPDHVLGGPHQAEGAGIELDVERQVTVPDLDVVEFAELAAAHDCELLVVSNTYLSAAQLAGLLARPATRVLHNARIFASSAHGVNKGDGLWKIVLGELDVAADRIVHVGDELVSDVEVPSGHGVHCVHFRRLAPGTASVLRREEVLPSDDEMPPLARVVAPGAGDFGLTGLRAKVGGRAEAVDLPADQREAWHFGAAVLGPILTGYAEWVHRRAVALGVRTVWCMMREGEFLGDLIGRAAAAAGSGIEARPVWLSRHVTARATLTEGDEEELFRLLNRRIAPTVREFLANLGLGLGEVPELRHTAGRNMDEPGLADDIVRTLVGREHLRARVLAESAGVRARLVDHLAPVLGEDGDTTLLVDLGWAGTIQAQLAKALTLSGIDRRLVGLYLATNQASAARVLDGVEIFGYLTEFGEPLGDLVQIGRSPEIIEQACLATCGSLLDFDTSGRPVLDNSVPPPEQVASKVAVQHGVRAFQREWHHYGAAIDDWPALDGRERPMLLEALRASVSNPTVEEARTFGAWTHDDNFGVDRRDLVIPERLGAYAPYLSPPDLLEMTMQDAFWPLGLAAEYDADLAAATLAVLGGDLDRSVFEASRLPQRVEISVDTGDGFAHGQHRRLRINRNGLSYAHFDVRADNIRNVRFDPCEHAALFRIDWIELGLRVHGNPEAFRFRLESPEDFAGFGYADCRLLYDGVAIASGGDPQVHIPVAHRVPGGIYGVDFTAAFAVLPLPPGGADVGAPARSANSVGWAIDKVRREAASGGPAAVSRGALRYLRRRMG